MKLSAKQFKQLKNKNLTLLGMSGVGKTHLAKLLGKDDNWFHYSGDYRIGSKYLKSVILKNIKNRIRQDTWLEKLLNNKSISVKNKITFDNLSTVSTFLGKVGNPELGGLPIDEFIRRQELFKRAEINTMLDVSNFIKKAHKKGFNNFINDAGGSLCELDDNNVYKILADNTIVLYIKASANNKIQLIERAKTHPKPLYYQADFLQKQLDIFLKNNNLTYVAQINPDEFVRWVFPRLIEHREPKYEKIADKYGYTIDSELLYKCKTATDVFDLINEVLK